MTCANASQYFLPIVSRSCYVGVIHLPHEKIALDSDAFISVGNEFHNISLYGKDPSLLEYDATQHFNVFLSLGL